MARTTQFPPSVKAGIPQEPKAPEGWKLVRFGDVIQVAERPAELEDDQEYQLVTAKRSRGGIVPREKLLGKDILTKTQFYINAGDFLISRRQIIHGACGLVPPDLDGALVSNEYSALLTTNNLLKEYLAYFSHTNYFQQTCFQSSVGVDVEKMIFKLEDWLKYKFPLPPVKEQQKISAVLGSVDEAISATQAVIDQTRKVKQGLLQQLLTRGIGHTKFKETAIGFIPESWEVTPLIGLAEYQNGKAFPSEHYCSEGVLLVRPGNLATEGFVVWDKEHTTHLPKFYWEQSPNYRVGGREILINLTAQSLEDQFLGRVCLTPDDNQCLLNQRIARVIPKSVEHKFLFWLLKGPHFRKHIDSLPKGSKVKHIYNRDLDTALLAIPSDRREQVRIAKILWSAQSAVSENLSQLESLKTLKRELMQDLLTGRVRASDD